MSRAISDNTFQSTVTGRSLLPINHWFVWKETRQLLPLIVALLLAAAALLLIQSEMFTSWTRVAPLAVLVFPGLFAVGAGTVLVGQEREQRTMDWLTTLPIPSRNLILIKIGVALAGLALMWALALATLAVTGIGKDYASSWLTFRGGRVAANNLAPPIGYPLWIVHSIYVMLCSFYASWRIKNQFLALIVIVPLACLPLVLCEFVLESVYYSSGQHLKVPANNWIRFFASFVSVPLMGMLVYRGAMRVLGPQSAPKYRISFEIQSLTKTLPATQSVIGQAPKFGSQINSIVWQSIHSVPLLWIALLAMLLFGTYFPIARFSSGVLVSDWFKRELWFMRDLWFVTDLVAFLAPLAVSWLGVSVFKNDGAPCRLQFLADRGIRPTKIYLGRHAVPIAIIALGFIVYTLLATYRSTHRMPNDGSGGLPSMATVALTCAVIYSISQWTSQVIRMLIVTAIVAPILSLLVLNWWSTAAANLSAPLWMLVAFSAMPLLATWWLMPRYMDMRDRPRSVLLGVGIAVMMIALPVVPQVWLLTKLHSSDEVVTMTTLLPLKEEGKAATKTAPNVVRLKVSYVRDVVASDATEILPEQALQRWNKRATTPEEFFSGLAELRSQPEYGATIPADAWKSLFGRLTFERLKFEESSGSKNSAAIEAFGSWIDAASLIAQRLRRNPKWFDQEVADRLEAWLVDTLNSDELAPHRDAEFFAAASARFPDAQQRQKSRRAGVLAGWANWSYPTPEERESFGLNRDPLVDQLAERFYLLPGGIHMMNLSDVVVVAADTLESNGASVNGLSWERRMHQALFREQMPFEIGPYAPRYRDLPSITTIDGTILYPARFWGLPWEDEAAALKLAFSDSDSPTQAEGDDQ